MLIDEISFELHAGSGGKGAVAFNKVPMMLGPTGADGGRGGSIYFEGVADINALMPLASRKKIEAEDGKDGRGQFVDGRDGEDLIIKIPTGTRITNLDTGYVQEMEHVGQQILAAGGGPGGRGNFKFRSPTNTSPQEFEYGQEGDTARYKLELLLIADVGLVGMPNAGKSSLLNELTRARSKVANYPFTTLEPHLGSYYGLILADIPGLIEGASGGKGLGVKFLKHVERTKMLFHLISAESEDPVRDYRTIRAELEKYGAGLATKQEYVFLSKVDMVGEDELAEKLAALKKAGIAAESISVIDDARMEKFRVFLNSIKIDK